MLDVFVLPYTTLELMYTKRGTPAAMLAVNSSRLIKTSAAEREDSSARFAFARWITAKQPDRVFRYVSG
jgi:hypothetical protein